MWTILEKVPCALEKNVYFTVFGGNVRYIFKSNWSFVSFKITVALLIFYLDDLSSDVSGVLKSPTIIVLSISLFMSVSIVLHI